VIIDFIFKPLFLWKESICLDIIPRYSTTDHWIQEFIKQIDLWAILKFNFHIDCQGMKNPGIHFFRQLKD
jgi:hypothetical protein